MTKKTRLIPFDYVAYKAGAKAVFKDYPVIEILQIFDNAISKDYLVIYKSVSNSFIHHEYVISEGLHIESEVEEKTFYVNVYDDEHYSNGHKSEEKADSHAKNSWGKRLGKLKVTYTDEDLIK